MAGIDDLLKGLQAFDKGVTEYAIGQGINDATKQLQAASDLQGQDLKDMHNQIAQDLSLRLTQAGANAAQVQAATSRIAPTLGAQLQTDLQRQLQEKSQTFSAAEAQKERDFRLSLAQMKANKQATVPRIRGLIADPNVDITKDDVKGVKEGISEGTKLMQQLNELRGLFAEHGTEAFGKNKSRMEGLLNSIQLIYKGPKFGALGVLTGPDKEILDAITGDVTGILPDFTGGIEAKLDQFSKNIANGIRTQTSSRGLDIDPKSELGLLTQRAGTPLRSLSNMKKIQSMNKTSKESEYMNKMMQRAQEGDDFYKNSLFEIYGIKVD